MKKSEVTTAKWTRNFISRIGFNVAYLIMTVLNNKPKKHYNA
jgi:hypothetical protein